MPPWQRPWPLIISPRTVIPKRAQPGPTPMIRMPRDCEARSRSNIARAMRVARMAASSSVICASCQSLASGSATGKAWGPLGAERGDAFGVVGGPAELTLIVALDIELLFERAIEAFVDRLFGA